MYTTAPSSIEYNLENMKLVNGSFVENTEEYTLAAVDIEPEDVPDAGWFNK